jgi:acetyl esterase/lipase
MTRTRLRAIRIIALVALLALAFASVAEAKNDKRYRDDMFKVAVKRDLVYGNAVTDPAYGEREDLLLDLYKPMKDKMKRRPAVVFIHGGSFCCGDKTSPPEPQLAKGFARMGYVAVSINYRLLVDKPCSAANGIPLDCFSAAIQDTHDAQAAVRWLRANAKRLKVDPKRIAASGSSAGAIIASGVGVMEDDPGESGNPGFPSDVGAFVSISGGLPDGLFVDENSAPGLLFASTGDPTVPYDWSVQTRDALVESGVTAKLTTFDSSVHVPFQEFRKKIEKQMRNFLYRELDLKRAVG